MWFARPCAISPSNASRPPLPLRGFRLAGKAYWAMERRVALTAAAIDAGCFRLFLWLDSMPLAAIKACSSRLPPSRGSVQFAKYAGTVVRHGQPLLSK